MHRRILFIFLAILIACLGNGYARVRTVSRSSGNLRGVETGLSAQAEENITIPEGPAAISSRCFIDHIVEAYELDFKLDKSFKRCSFIKNTHFPVMNASGINRAFSSMVAVPPGTLKVIRI